MTDYKMTEELAKVLTELVDECWHLTGGGVSEDMLYFKCSVCGKWLHLTDIDFGCQHTFTTPNDAHKVMEKLVEKGLWDKFYWTVRKITDSMPDNAYTTQWLYLNKERFCCLAALFMKEKLK